VSDVLIQVQNLKYRYPGASEGTLHGLDFSLSSGEIYGFLGPSGAGKSTTQKVLYRLLDNYQGSVLLFDKEIRDWDTSIYEEMGIGFETPNLYLKLTGRENLQFALAMRRKSQVIPREIEEAGKRLGLAEVLDDRIETYSKGMKMRLAFIRAVLHKPRLLFLDEPTSGLDPQWARRIKDWILEIRSQGTAVFITTHSMELADELCHKVGFLVDGALMLQENPTELKQRYGSSGVVIRGTGKDGNEIEASLTYDELLQGSMEQLCQKKGIKKILRVQNQEVSLEEVFLQVTGRSLQEETPSVSGVSP